MSPRGVAIWRRGGAWVVGAAWIGLVAAGCGEREKRGDVGDLVEVRRVDMPQSVLVRGTVKLQVGAQVKVGPRISGRLERLLVRVGDRVQRGQVLAEVDRPDLRVAVRRAEARVREAEARLRLAETIFARRSQLVPSGIMSQEDADEARREKDVARAVIASAKAELEAARIERAYTKITAPISGTVASVSTQEGETVAASLASPTFVTIVDLNRLEVEAYVDEVDIGQVHAGQEARFSVEAFSDRTFVGTVEAVNPQAVIRENIVNYAVIIRMKEPHPELRPDMTATVTILTGAQRGVLVVPSRAVLRENGQAFVTVQEGGRLVRRAISLGRELGDLVGVRVGLSEGEKVLVRPGLDREPGQ